MKELLLLLALALLTPAVSAQPADLDALLRDIREVRNTEQAAMRERETRFLAERNEQQSRLRQAEEALSQVQVEADRLKAEFDRQEQALVNAEAQLAQRSGNLGELFGVVRQAAGDTRSQWQDSLLNMQLPGRKAALEQLAGSRQIPTLEALESFWFLLQQDMTASGKISRFVAPVVGLDGEQRELSVIRVGPFVALQGEDYLLYQPEAERLQVAERQPDGRGLVDDFMRPRTALADLKVDPTRGNVIQQLQQTPSLTERIHQGGVVGYVIIALGLLGLLLALVRMERALLVLLQLLWVAAGAGVGVGAGAGTGGRQALHR